MLRDPFHLPPGLALVLATLCTLGCASGPEFMMETPVIYGNGELDPFGGLPKDQRTSTVEVLYATERAPGGNSSPQSPDSPYGNEVDPGLRFGVARVQFGDPALSWDELHSVSTNADRPREVELVLSEVVELGNGPPDEPGEPFLRELAERLDRVPGRELLIYVHGAKVDFYRATARTAELAHFAGRHLVPLVFDWPSHPNIIDYVIGPDRGRAERAAVALRALIERLAELGIAQRIHLLGYSAGGIVATDALEALRESHPEMSASELRSYYRIGVVLLASADVPVEEFLDEVESIHDLAERICITVSDHDSVLEWSTKLFAGGDRIGELKAWQSPEAIAALHRVPRLEIVDVSHGKEQRGFNIEGHHYWYRHPWVSSDVILDLRHDLSPSDRGLEPIGIERFWYLPTDYPQRSRAAVEPDERSVWIEALEEARGP